MCVAGVGVGVGVGGAGLEVDGPVLAVLGS